MFVEVDVLVGAFKLFLRLRECEGEFLDSFFTCPQLSERFCQSVFGRVDFDCKG